MVIPSGPLAVRIGDLGKAEMCTVRLSHPYSAPYWLLGVRREWGAFSFSLHHISVPCGRKLGNQHRRLGLRLWYILSLDLSRANPDKLLEFVASPYLRSQPLCLSSCLAKLQHLLSTVNLGRTPWFATGLLPFQHLFDLHLGLPDSAHLATPKAGVPLALQCKALH